MDFDKFTVIKSEKLSRKKSSRYIVVSEDTGEILDDANGFGYRTKKNAEKAYTYKLDFYRPKQQMEYRAAFRWLLRHEKFDLLMGEIHFEIARKGEWNGHEKFDSKVVKELLEQEGYTEDLGFSPRVLLRAWKGLVMS